MHIIHQYYNEISLNFADYDTNYIEGIIIIYVADDNKPFDLVRKKIEQRLAEIAENLDDREEDVIVEIRKTGWSKSIVLAKNSTTEEGENSEN